MKKLIMPLAVSLAVPAYALPPIGEPGLGGTFNVGYSAGQIETNFLEEIDGLDIDLGPSKIDSLDSPGAEDIDMPMAQIDIGWNFANGKTRIALGNDFTDILEFDRTTRLSVRHDFDSLGEFRVDYLHPTGLTTRVYRDPYQTDVDRAGTDEEVSGGRFVWDAMFGSGFGLQFLAKQREIDNEDSGVAAGLSAADQDLLDREGDLYTAELSYRYEVDEWHAVRPALSYVNRDLDGDAMAQEGGIASLEHFYIGSDVSWGNKIAYTYLEGDEENPLFDEVHDSSGFAVSSIVTFTGIDALGSWAPNLQATWADSDSDVDFNDSSIWTIGAGIGLRF